MRKTTLVLMVSLFLGCGTETGQIETETRIVALADACLTFFRPQWCGSNLSGRIEISSVCPGKSYSDDIIYSSILVKSEGGDRCFIYDGAPSEEVAVLGCAKASRTTYEGSGGSVAMLFCYDSDGKLISLKGAIEPGAQFRVLNPQ